MCMSTAPQVTSFAAKVQNPCAVPNQGPCSRPRQARWCALKLTGAGKLPGYSTHTGWALSAQKCACTLPRAQARPQNQGLRLSSPNFGTKFLNVETMKQNTPLSSSRKLVVLGLPGEDSPKYQKDTYPTGGLAGRDITRGQCF